MIAIARHFARAGLLLGFSTLLIVTTEGNWVAKTYNDPDGGNGYSPVFIPGQYHAPAQLPLLFPPNAQIALAEQAATANQLPLAKQHLYSALMSNPASGLAVSMLFNIYTQPDIYVITDIPDDAAEDDSQETPAATASIAPSAPLATELNFALLNPADRVTVDKLAAINLRLNPTDTPTLEALAHYWFTQGQQAKAIRLWSDLLVNNSGAGSDIFPRLHQALKTPELKPLFDEYLASPPPWWVSFFQYLLEHEPDAGRIQSYYLARQQAAQPPSLQERDSYVNHLIKQQRWLPAYQIWSGATALQTTHETKPETVTTALLYDGGFEDNNSQHTPFAWNIHSIPEAKIKLAHGGGVTGKQALHITFRKNKSVLFKQVAQTRVLPAGHYSLQGRYRLNRLKNNHGLRWRVSCIDGDTNTLGESDAFKGHSEWETFSMKFSVPPTCQAQQVRLESDSQYAHHNQFEGEIWFDDMSIQAGQRKGNTP